MYCTYCGALNPNGFRFCHACGKPAPQSDVTTGSAPVSGSDFSSPSATFSQPIHKVIGSGSAELSAMRKTLIKAAVAYSRRDDLKTPFDLVDSDLIKNTLTQEDVENLVWPDHFTQDEQTAFSQDTDVLLIYIDMLGIVAETIESQTLLEGVFWLQALVLYNSSLNSMVENRAWTDFDRATMEYLEEARHTGSALALLEPLVKSAFAKLQLRDVRTCKALLEEFDRALEMARRETPHFDYPKGGQRTQWIESQRDTARTLRKLI